MTIKPITYLSVNLGPEAGIDDSLVGVRVVPDGSDSHTVYGRTLKDGEEDCGQAIVLQVGERLVFPERSVRITIRDVDRYSTEGSDGYADIANTVWTWLQFGPSPDLEFFRFIFAAARRLDSAHAHWATSTNQTENVPGEGFIRTRARIFRALGDAESMCIALNRSAMMIRKIPSKFAVSPAVPSIVNEIYPALNAIRNAFEHIDERALGKVHGSAQPDALTIFDQKDFLTSHVLRYAGHSLDLRQQVLPALIDGRQFIFDVASEKAGPSKTLNAPIEFGPVTAKARADWET